MTIEELCGHDPAESAEMRKRLQAVASMMAFLEVDAEPGPIGARPTEGDGSDGSSSTVMTDDRRPPTRRQPGPSSNDANPGL